MSRSTNRSAVACAVTALLTILGVSASGAPQPIARSSAVSGVAPSAQDLAYLKLAAQSNLSEIAQGRLARDNARRNGIEAFGEVLLLEHRRQYRALQAVAAQLGVALPTVPSIEQRSLVRSWRDLRGGPFDCAYIPFQWAEHQLMIATTTQEVEEGSDPSVRQTAADTLPALVQHQRRATRLLKRLGRC